MIKYILRYIKSFKVILKMKKNSYKFLVGKLVRDKTTQRMNNYGIDGVFSVLDSDENYLNSPPP